MHSSKQLIYHFLSDQMEIRTAGVIVLLHWILTTSRLAEDAVDIDVLKDLLNPFLFCYAIPVSG